jgi:homoserine O-acetyltransferase
MKRSSGVNGFAPSSRMRRLFLDGPLELESGAVLPRVEVAYRTWGRLSAGADNVVIVCHALTGSVDADVWWAPLFGANRAIDPRRDFVLCSNVLGGCYGTTGPASIAPDGRLWGARFPRLTVRDQVRAQIALADQLGIRRIRLVIGGSMGGLQALEWALMDPERVQAVASIAASGRHSSWCVVWSEAQRMALAADPKFRDGHYDPDDPPVAGLAAARAIAMVTYRSPGSLAQRFGRAPGAEVFGSRSLAPDDFAVSGWLRHHGSSLVSRFDANSYRVLLDAMDTHDLARGRGDYAETVARLWQPVLLVSISTDTLYVPAEQRALAELLPAAEWVQAESDHGHDGFLIDAVCLEPLVREFRARIGTGVLPVRWPVSREGQLSQASPG